MKIDRIKNSMGDFYDYSLMEGNKELLIFFARNYDLYMLLSTNKLLPPNENVTMDFDITKENFDLYHLFDQLYKKIVNSKPLDEDSSIYYVGKGAYEDLVDQDLNITWISDNGPEEIEDKVVISREEDSYKLTFIRNDKPMDFGFKTNTGIAIRFRNSGSRYFPFNSAFMELYRGLQKINPEYHQIAFEELEYNKQLIKKQ